MVYTIGCNFRCPYCHNPELVLETVEVRVDESEVLAFLKKRQGLLDGVVVTGGEPTLHGDALVHFLKLVRSLGFLIKLDTNGTHPSVLRTLIALRLVDYLAMDIKSPLDQYPRVVSMPVASEVIYESIQLLKSSGIPYEFRTTVVKALLSPDDILQIAALIAGSRAYYLQKFMPSMILNPQFIKKVSYTHDEYTTIAHAADQFVPTYIR